ncbi:MAG: DUF805 domain-containing protein [Muribaculaceae bacterium]|nr:DUF805 domain-containing protein [Muribaculaceae bacterium]
MSTKEQIINNLREYSASEIVHAIKCGEVSMYELSKKGKLTPLMKKKIEEQMACESVEINVTGPVTESSEEFTEGIPPSVNENLEEQAIAATPTETDIPSIPVITPVLSSQSTEIDSEILDNKGMFKRVFSFKGRIRRTEFGLSYIIFLAWYLGFVAVTEMNDVNPVLALFIILTIVPAYWFLWAQGAKDVMTEVIQAGIKSYPFIFLSGYSVEARTA